MGKSKIKNITISDIIAFVGIIAVLSWNVCQQSKINETNYLSRAAHKPFLKNIGNPVIEQMALTADTLRIEKTTNEEIGNIEFKLKLHLSLKLVNDSDNDARLLFSGIVDTLSDQAIIRNKFRDKKFDVVEDNTFRDRIIQQGDTLELSFIHSVNFIKGNAGVFHFFVVYENDFGIMFDTYIWSRFKVNEFEFLARPIYDRFPGIEFKYAKKDLYNLVEFQKSIVDQHRYSENEKEEITEFMFNNLEESLQEKLEIQNLNTVVLSPESTNETWAISTKLRKNEKLTPKYSYMWFDSLSTLRSDFEDNSFSQSLQGLTLLDSTIFEVYLRKHFVIAYYKRKLDVFKHIVARYEDHLGVEYQVDLTEKLIINKKKITWETIRDTTYTL